jgi:tetratricopeptide (TPR) repeat protein
MRLSDQARSLGVETVDTSRTAALIHVYRGALTQSADAAERALAMRSTDTVALRLLRDADLRADRPDRARERYAAAYPELVSDKVPQFAVGSFFAAIDLAMVLQQTGETARADMLLDRSLEFIRSLGTSVVGGFAFVEHGYAVAGAQIAALRGQPAEALAALRQAEQQGWRAGWRYYRDHDPAFVTIRGSPEFKAVFADIERDMAQQRARVAARPKNAPLDLAATGK